MSAKKPQAKGKAAAPVVSVAQDLHVDTDLRRLLEACAQLEGESFGPVAKRVKGELTRVKDGDQEGVPQVPLYVSGPVSYEDFKLLVGVVLPPYPFLRVLQFHHCELGDDSILCLAEFLRVYKPLPDRNPFGVEVLELPGCAIGVRGAGYLGRILSENATLKRLVLDFNRFGDDGAVAVCNGLRWNGTLAELSLQYCGIGPVGAQTIASRVIKGSNVRVLNLRGNPLRDVGVKSIAQSLCVGTRLAELDLADTRFGGQQETVEALCEGMETSASLTSVNVDMNTFIPDGAQSLLVALQKNKQIVGFAISERVDGEVYRAILDTVAQNKKGMKKPKRKKSKA